MDLSERIARQLPPELVNFLRAAGKMAQESDRRLYVVGGVVRDLLLERTNLDLDLVVEGDAVGLARALAGAYNGKIVAHSRFGTAKVRWDSWSADLATARSETYACPGALPAVKPGSIRDDLFRRDFTINAMAVELSASRYGELLDFFGGRDDLERKLIHVLHDKSFIDDATRIWRALRYEQRLDFQLEPVTLALLKRDLRYLDAISGDRIRHELELVLKEARPEKVLRRASELGVLNKVHPVLKGDGWLAERFERARRLSTPDSPSIALYLALLTYSLNSGEIERLISYLKLPKLVARTLRDTLAVRANLEKMTDPGLPPSAVHSLLSGYSLAALTANLLAADSPVVRHHIELFLSKLRYIRPALTGEDLKRMGVPAGPRLGEIMGKLLKARLDGAVTSKKDEEELVRRLVS